MLFSKTMIHGVYVLCYLSRQPEDMVIPAGPIADAMNVPPEQAAKILQSLTRAGLVRSARGRRGGYALAKKPDAITLDELVEALGSGDEQKRLGSRECPVRPGYVCSAYHGLEKLYDCIRQFLSTQTLAPLIESTCEIDDASFKQVDRRPFPDVSLQDADEETRAAVAQGETASAEDSSSSGDETAWWGH
jgi:Rrf2 family protein